MLRTANSVNSEHRRTPIFIHIGATYKVRNAIFDQFLPPPCHTLSHI